MPLKGYIHLLDSLWNVAGFSHLRPFNLSAKHPWFDKPIRTRTRNLALWSCCIWVSCYYGKRCYLDENIFAPLDHALLHWFMCFSLLRHFRIREWVQDVHLNLLIIQTNNGIKHHLVHLLIYSHGFFSLWTSI